MKLAQTLIKKPINPQILVEQQKLLQNKAIFLQFCEHFKTKTLSDLLNDKIFMQYMHDSIHKEPTLHSRAFQLALEVTYSKRKFNEKVLQDLYKNDFQILDTFDVNKGLCDQSTIYTATLAKKAIMGILDTYDNSLKASIEKITHNSIQFDTSKIEELD